MINKITARTPGAADKTSTMKFVNFLNSIPKFNKHLKQVLLFIGGFSAALMAWNTYWEQNNTDNV